MKKITIYRLSVAVFVGLFISVFCYFNYSVYSAPFIADYILGTLPTDNESIAKLAKFDVLIVSAEQGVIRKNVLVQIKKINPKIILLAYVPSESTNDSWREYPANTLYGDFQMNDNWWLRDSAGKPISDWARLHNADMSQGWSDYLIGFTRDKILSQGVWDGVFWDMVYDTVADRNHGDIDLNRDGVKDDRATLNAEWLVRMNYLLSESQKKLPVKYILINGNSIPSLQKYVNGRMYENYPTPWEAGGSWSGIMTGLKRNEGLNAAPKLYVFNANTGNSGNQKDYRKMRFGFASSLILDDVYFGFDYGDKDHNQIWWYDEYDTKLGNPSGQAVSVSGQTNFNNNEVWRREYQNGVALVNPSATDQTVDLGSDYEKIIGKQDPGVNDGSIVDKVVIKAHDGIVMRKTAQNIFGTPFKNGSMVRLFDMKGNRTRNGYFSFVDGAAGGARVFVGDLDGKGQREKIVAGNGRFEIFNSAGLHWFESFPFSGQYTNELRFAVGSAENGESRILVAPAIGSSGILYNYFGEITKENIAPFGLKYKSGFYVAFGKFDGTGSSQAVIGSGGGRVGEVLISNQSVDKVLFRFFPFDKKYTGKVKVAAGDLDGDGNDEIIAMGKIGTKNIVRVFDSRGKKLSEFSVSSPFGNGDLNIGTTVVFGTGRAEIVIDGM